MNSMRTSWMTALLCLIACVGCAGGDGVEPVCTPEEKKCDGTDLVKCNSAGAEWVFYKECDKHCSGGECTADAPLDAYSDIRADAVSDIALAADQVTTPDGTLVEITEVVTDVASEVELNDTFVEVSDVLADIYTEVEIDDSFGDLLEVEADEAGEDVCQPSCDGKECGDDGCGKSCGSCDDYVPCTADLCTEGGKCVHPFQENCCVGDQDCTKGDACTIGMCNEGICDYEKIADPLPCDDDGSCNDCNPCTEDTCNAGSCEHTPELGLPAYACCLNTDDCLTQCNTTCANVECIEHKCEVTPLPNCCDSNLACDDGNACTCDSCVFSICQHSSKGQADGICGQEMPDGCCATGLDCDDDNLCTDDYCPGEPNCGPPAFECLHVANDYEPCAGKECGPDGCGGSCGECSGVENDCVEGECTCKPVCEGKHCGPDGCGASCGECLPGVECTDGKCSPHLTWVKTFAGIGHDRVSAVAVAPNGDIGIVGYTNSPTIDFGEGPVATIKGYDVFVLLFSPDGQLLWSKIFGGVGNDMAFDLSFDSLGNIHLVGSFGAGISFGGWDLPGSGNSFDNAFVAKLDHNGEHVWSVSYGGAAADRALGVGVGGDGSVYVAGEYGSVNLDLGGTLWGHDETECFNNNCSANVFLLKLDSIANYEWSTAFGGIASETVRDLALDSQGHIHVAGASSSSNMFSDPGDFSAGKDYQMGSGGCGVIPPCPITSYAIEFDSAGGYVVGGGTSPTEVFAMDFYGDTKYWAGRRKKPTPPSNFEAYVYMEGSPGNPWWQKEFGGSGVMDEAWALAVDSEGSVYTSGRVESNAVNFGGGFIANNGAWDAFIVKLGIDGTHIWSTVFGGANMEMAFDTAVDSEDAVLVVGDYYSETVTVGSHTLENLGENDVFFVRLID